MPLPHASMVPRCGPAEALEWLVSLEGNGSLLEPDFLRALEALFARGGGACPAAAARTFP